MPQSTKLAMMMTALRDVKTEKQDFGKLLTSAAYYPKNSFTRSPRSRPGRTYAG